MAVSRGTALPYPPPPGLKATEPEPTPEPDPPEVTVTAQQLADESGVSLERATRVLPVAARMVTDYAPTAPVELLDEATYRFGGYLLASGYGETRTETIGPMSIEHQTNHSGMFRNCGAAALLTHFKRRRGGAIG